MFASAAYIQQVTMLEMMLLQRDTNAKEAFKQASIDMYSILTLNA